MGGGSVASRSRQLSGKDAIRPSTGKKGFKPSVERCFETLAQEVHKKFSDYKARNLAFDVVILTRLARLRSLPAGHALAEIAIP